MKIEDLEWDMGRALIRLPDGTGISIITPERNSFIRRHIIDSRFEDFVDVQADGDLTWEIAFIDEDQNCIKDAVPEFEEYRVLTSGWHIYREVPIPLVMAYINEKGGAQVDDDG